MFTVLLQFGAGLGYILCVILQIERIWRILCLCKGIKTAIRNDSVFTIQSQRKRNSCEWVVFTGSSLYST